jgi:hypothetical protein
MISFFVGERAFLSASSLEGALPQFGPDVARDEDRRDSDCGAILHEEARHKARAYVRMALRCDGQP